MAFSVSAACAGLGGALLAWVNSLAAPGAFPLTLSLSLLTAAVLGGMGSLAGAVYGAVIVTLLPNWAQDLAQAAHLSQSIYANIPLVVYGVVLFLVVVLFPGGIQAGLIRLWRALHITIR
jgi:branched-chain amino acid transport system permease protein